MTPPDTSQAPGFFLLYLHGFNSSPGSLKARLLQQYWQAQGWSEQRLCIPALPFSPQQAMAGLEHLLQQAPAERRVVMGSSLGGYYATWLAERYGLQAVVINPAVRPYELLQDRLGPQRNYHTGECCTLGSEHLLELRALEVARLSKPDNLLLLAQTGDETLDYREAVEKYRGSASIIQPGGSHGFDDFETMLPTIFEFFTGEATPQEPASRSLLAGDQL